ncbi:hypothetical protein RFI_11747 [Reticulomyxa filosa]|uniref:Uncharacterized protein n=1 Tax=Reticulomyxa filosa TaxID=46433 RepID=X6NHF7_RETFI|nr:hypothetical protein RFI_11747 [Reticulomyxa filosa]|eukprot:ETO25391.1 hypothetical protein RFI_11747 [Reticulomyxa filosa]
MKEYADAPMKLFEFLLRHYGRQLIDGDNGLLAIRNLIDTFSFMRRFYLQSLDVVSCNGTDDPDATDANHNRNDSNVSNPKTELLSFWPAFTSTKTSESEQADHESASNVLRKLKRDWIVKCWRDHVFNSSMWLHILNAGCQYLWHQLLADVEPLISSSTSAPQHSPPHIPIKQEDETKEQQKIFEDLLLICSYISTYSQCLEENGREDEPWALPLLYTAAMHFCYPNQALKGMNIIQRCVPMLHLTKDEQLWQVDANGVWTLHLHRGMVVELGIKVHIEMESNIYIIFCLLHICTYMFVLIQRSRRKKKKIGRWVGGGSKITDDRIPEVVIGPCILYCLNQVAQSLDWSQYEKTMPRSSSDDTVEKKSDVVEFHGILKIYVSQTQLKKVKHFLTEIITPSVTIFNIKENTNQIDNNQNNKGYLEIELDQSSLLQCINHLKQKYWQKYNLEMIEGFVDFCKQYFHTQYKFEDPLMKLLKQNQKNNSTKIYKNKITQKSLLVQLCYIVPKNFIFQVLSSSVNRFFEKTK